MQIYRQIYAILLYCNSNHAWLYAFYAFFPHPFLKGEESQKSSCYDLGL